MGIFVIFEVQRNINLKGNMSDITLKHFSSENVFVLIACSHIMYFLYQEFNSQDV